MMSATMLARCWTIFSARASPACARLRTPSASIFSWSSAASWPGFFLASCQLSRIPAAGQHRFELTKLMQGGPSARSIRQTEVTDFTRGPLRPVVDLAPQDDARAHIGADVNQDEGFLCLRGAAISLSLGGQVGIVLNNDQAVYDPAQLGAQRHGTPVFQSADRQHDALVHIGNGGHAHHQREQLFPLLPVLAQQAPHFFADVDTNGVGGCFPVGQRDFLGVKFTPVQVRQQERKAVGGNLHREHAPALRLERNHVRRPAPVGLTLAERL